MAGMVVVVRRPRDAFAQVRIEIVRRRINQRRDSDRTRRRVSVAERRDTDAGSVQHQIVWMPQIDAEGRARRHH
jgi:hypothetical protein